MVNVREVWKDIKDFEGLYQVSNLGNVKSLDRKHTYFAKNQNITRTIKGTMLKQPLDRYGYKKVVLLKHGKYHFFTAHRLVALNFIDNINNLPQVNHINSNRKDNRVENLEWCTNKQNIQHGIKNGNIKLNGEENPNAKIKNKDIKNIEYLFYQKKMSMEKIAKKYNVHSATISSHLKKIRLGGEADATSNN